MKRPLRLLTFCFVATAASASPLQKSGVGPRAVGMGQAMTAEATDFSATFYNPAMLAKSTMNGVQLGFYGTGVSTSVTPTDARVLLDCASCSPPAALGLSFGGLFRIGGKLKDKAAIGVVAYLPTSALARVRAIDPSRPYWYRYGADQERIGIFLGGGIEIFKGLSIGAGIDALADLVGSGANVSVDLFTKRVQQREVDSYLATRTAPLFGLAWSHGPLRLGLSYFWEMGLHYRIPADVEIQDVGVLTMTIDGVTHYQPHTLVGGASYRLGSDVTLTFDLEYARWSSAPSPYVSLAIDLSGSTLAALGLDDALDLASVENKPGFSDTLTPRIGMEYRFNDRVAVRAGASYRPTFVPKQNVSGTNVLDASAIIVALGMGIKFPDPSGVFTRPLSFDLAGQASILLPRDAEKEASDTIASYRYSAAAFAGNAAFSYDF